MFRFHRLAVLISAAGIAAAPSAASERGWRSEPAAALAEFAERAPSTAPCWATARQAAGRSADKSQSLAPQSSQTELRNAAAARIARLWGARRA